MAGKFRHELKFYINTATYYVLRHRLSALLSLDENAREETGDYHIRSLYFDDREDSQLVSPKSPARTAVKNSGCASTTWKRAASSAWSAKSKKDQYILKHSCGLTRKEFELLMEGECSFFATKGQAACRELCTFP